MSVMTWGEPAEGIWNVEVMDQVQSQNYVSSFVKVINFQVGSAKDSGTVRDTFLILHGTRTFPEHMKNGPRKYNKNYNEQKPRATF